IDGFGCREVHVIDTGQQDDKQPDRRKCIEVSFIASKLIVLKARIKADRGKWLWDGGILTSNLISKRLELLVKYAGKLVVEILRVIAFRHQKIGIDLRIPKSLGFDLSRIHHPFTAFAQP